MLKSVVPNYTVVPNYKYAHNGKIINKNGFVVHNGAMLHLAKKYIETLNTASQNQQVRQRSASQQIENNSKRINTLLDNAAKTLKTSTETPTAAVYAKNSINIEHNLNVLLAKTPQNKQTHTVYFCFTFEDAAWYKRKEYTYRLQLYKYDDPTPMIYKIGLMNDGTLGVKQENSTFDATRLVKETLDITTQFKNGSLATLENLLETPDPVIDEKVNLYDLFAAIMTKNESIRFIPIAPPSNSGGYRKKHTRRYKKHTRRHRRTYTKK